MTSLWLQLGYEHILDPDGYDHILYLVTLCAVYELREWKRVLMLATAFTIGHSITLALNVWDIVTVPGSIIEPLIPITIILTALHNIYTTRFGKSNGSGYLLAVLFGLIHGMGISNYLKSMMGPGDSLGWTLFGFNVGVELAQIVVVMASLLLGYLALKVMKVSKDRWTYGVSAIAILVCIYLLSQ